MPSSIMRLPVVHHPAYQASLRPGHRFPMGKFRRLAEVLVERRIVDAERFFAPVEAPAGWLMLAHDPGYVTAVLGGTVDASIERRIGFSVDTAVARRARLAASGTLLAARLALEAGIACNTAGGGHHAAFGHGAGFCVFNDVAIAARVLLAEGAVGRVAVIDCDVHQGDGTAAIFSGDERVFTVSVHAESNFPARKVAGDLDIGLPDETGDDGYLAVLEAHLPAVLDRVRPELVFYNAGIDPHGDDHLGRLALTDDGLRARDDLILRECLKRNVAVAGVIGGGYGDDIDTLARRHAILHETAAGLVP
jgi:acetoin utilization deacetylase AcuC-like enzyme